MSAENDWFEYHLTPEGWAEGSRTVGHFAQVAEVPVPPDRVLTIRFRTYQSSSFAKTRHWYEVPWEHDDPQVVADLKARWGALPAQYSHWTPEGYEQ
jgi:hypothetical protein